MRKTSFARHLRRTQTDAERILWLHLRNRQLGAKFKRQEPMGLYIVDFICINKKIIIELDGSQHLTEQGIENDKNRTAYLCKLGYTLIRFTDTEVLTETVSVLDKIYLTLSLS